MTCACCGINYSAFRTGMTYAEVFAQFWVADDDPDRWRNKRRRTVLGRWREIKQRMWREHCELCSVHDFDDYEPVEEY